jgi:hypothetical protein
MYSWFTGHAEILAQLCKSAIPIPFALFSALFIAHFLILHGIFNFHPEFPDGHYLEKKWQVFRTGLIV